MQKRSVVGLLSLFEHYGSCEVGSHLKTPELPIWVIYAESHFTVLFSTDGKLVETSSLAPFEVHYHDQLGQMDGAYVLTVGEGLMGRALSKKKKEKENAAHPFLIFLAPDPAAGLPRPSDKDLVAPLDHCIRTK